MFLGVAEEIRYKTIVVDKVSFRQQVVRFSVEDAFAGVRSKTITVIQGPVCDYVFHKGVRYLVDAERTSESSLEAGSCGMTTPAEYAADSIHFLRTLREHQSGAIVFGTVKQYAKGSTFVSLNNKPVAASVLLRTAPDTLLAGEERQAAVDSNGYYEFVGVPEGIYTHIVKVPEGFTGVLQHTVEIKKDSCAEVEVRVNGKTD